MEVTFYTARCVACLDSFVLGQKIKGVQYFNTGFGGDQHNVMNGVVHDRPECRQKIIDYSTSQNWGNPITVVEKS